MCFALEFFYFILLSGYYLAVHTQLFIGGTQALSKALRNSTHEFYSGERMFAVN